MNVSASPANPPPPEPQALRLKRFLIGSTTYAFGYAILIVCNAVGLFRTDALLLVGTAFAIVNGGLFVVFRGGHNLRAGNDPSLTQIQVTLGVAMVALILVVGEHVHFLAVPFYSSLFVFAMLRLKPRELLQVEACVLGTYALAMAVRMSLYAGRLDLRVEGITATLVVVSTVWFAMAASYISELRSRLRESLIAIESLASRDALTDTWNRRHIDSLLADELERRDRAGSALTVGIVDVDHFKAINDRFGHLVGDAVLRDVAQVMKVQLRAVDQIGRFGGEEFLVVLPNTALDAARFCAERLLQAVASLTILDDPAERVTISVGLAACEPGEAAEALLTRADAALYQAKRDGRNRIVLGRTVEENGEPVGSRKPAKRVEPMPLQSSKFG